MAKRRFLIENGTGVDMHGGDMTKAAQKAVKDALSHCCMAGVREIHNAGPKDIALRIKICCPRPEELDLNRVIRMCLIHDLGEAFTGDIPTFVKTDADSRREDDLFDRWIQTLPADVRGEWESLLEEMNAQKTGEAKLYKALDRLEAVIQHNESDIDSWLPLEYSLQLTYGAENVRFSPYLRELKQEIDQWTREKIAASEQKNQ